VIDRAVSQPAWVCVIALFEVHEGLNINSFVRQGDVAAHLVLPFGGISVS
jgi:hypothetical protein